MKRNCSTPDCARKYRARGYCAACYARLRATGEMVRLFDLPPAERIGLQFARFLGEPTASGCTPWLGALDRDGYGELWVQEERTSVGAHRVALWLRDGVWPPRGRVVDHACHIPYACPGGSLCAHRRCVNTDHLQIVTDSVNASVGRRASVRGASHPRALLAESDVVEIRRLYAGGDTSQAALALQFNVGQGAISAAVTRKTWKHVA